MALYCWPCDITISCPKSLRNYAIQRPFARKMSISKTSEFETIKISISAPTKFNNTFIQTAKCNSSLSFLGELDEGFPPKVTVFVKGLAQATSEGGLNEAFSRYGDVSQVKIVRDKRTKLSLGYAYVWFVKEEHAQASAAEMNGEFFEGRFIQVSLAKPEACKPRSKHSPYKF